MVPAKPCDNLQLTAPIFHAPIDSARHQELQRPGRTILAQSGPLPGLASAANPGKQTVLMSRFELSHDVFEKR